MSERISKRATVAAALFFAVGSALRVLLCWANPPSNAFDNHFQPILLIMRSGTIPAKDACWQCYHPPVFYWISAALGDLLVAAGVAQPSLFKSLQLLNGLYGILTPAVVYLVLRRLPLSDLSRVLAFGTVCFLPRHIYMSAMNANDSISYLFVALTVYLLLVAIDKGLPLRVAMLTGLVASLTVFTKYTAYAVLPALAVPLAVLYAGGRAVARRRVLAASVPMLVLPLLLLGSYWAWNTVRYGSPLPWNVSRVDPSRTQPRDAAGLDFVTFAPWQAARARIIAPGAMHSYWTMAYSGMWFDTEPKFLYFLDANRDWWNQYYAWLRGERSYPGDDPAMSSVTKAIGSSLIALGLVPLLLVVAGAVRCATQCRESSRRGRVAEVASLSLFPALLAGTAAISVALAVRLPVFSATKASYWLSALPAFAVFLGLGVVTCERSRAVRSAVAVILCLLFALATLHVMHIAWSLTR